MEAGGYNLMDLSDARAFHDEVSVIDLHADTLKLVETCQYDLSIAHERVWPCALNYAGHVDIPRMFAGGLRAQFFGMWTFPYPQKGCAASIHRQLDSLHNAVTAYPDLLLLAKHTTRHRARPGTQSDRMLGGNRGCARLRGQY